MEFEKGKKTQEHAVRIYILFAVGAKQLGLIKSEFR